MIKSRCSRVSLVLFIAIGAFLIGAVSAQAEDGFTNGCVGNVINKKANCTANDVRLTAVSDGGLDITETCADGPKYCVGGTNAGGVCTAAADCPGGVGCFNQMTFTATGQFTAGPQRYDVGVYIATDGDPNGDGARTGTCERFRFSLSDPNAEDLDGDSCGDILANTTQEVTFGPVTVACIDTNGDGSVDIINCETWGNAIDEIPDGKSACDEISDVRAGTPSKCSCGLLPICIAIADDNACDAEVCRFTCSADSIEECDPTSATACSNAPANCTERAVSVPVENGTTCGAGGDDCNNPFECQEGVCVAGGPKDDGTGCGSGSDTECDNPDTCLSGICVVNHEPATIACGHVPTDPCDQAEHCVPATGLCEGDVCRDDLPVVH